MPASVLRENTRHSDWLFAFAANGALLLSMTVAVPRRIPPVYDSLPWSIVTYSCW